MAIIKEIHKLGTNGQGLSEDIKLAFIKSSKVKVYPCGRRRSQPIDQDKKTTTPNDVYYIPFDPEARLNTEFNNRHYSGLNGFDQSYLKQWSDEESNKIIVLGGYTFYLDLDTLEKTADFVKSLEDKGLTEASNAIYVNIRLERIQLFEGFTDYYTWVLRNQSATGSALTELDLLKTGETESEDFNNYYFSGLSFSVEALTGENEVRSIVECDIKSNVGTSIISTKQQIISLRLFEKINETWTICQEALLPQIIHGKVENSAIIDTLNTNILQQKGKPVSILEIAEVVKESGDTFHQLQFSFDTSKTIVGGF